MVTCCRTSVTLKHLQALVDTLSMRVSYQEMGNPLVWIVLTMVGVLFLTGGCLTGFYGNRLYPNARHIDCRITDIGESDCNYLIIAPFSGRYYRIDTPLTMQYADGVTRRVVMFNYAHDCYYGALVGC